MAKSSNYPGSILSNSARLVGLSSSDWGSCRIGNQVKIGSDNISYTVAKVNKIYYIKDFSVLNPKTIEIKANIGIDLMPEDVLTLSYKEFEVLTIFGITNPGRDYKEGQIIYLSGGDLSVSLEHNLTNPASFQVTKVDENGGILEVGLHNNGVYVNVPPKNNEIFSNDEGSGAILDVEFKPIDNRKILDRTITHLDNKTTSCNLYLNYDIPSKLKTGKLSVEKYEILLSSNYVGDTQINVPCQICRDFTPNLGIPLMAKNSFSFEMIYNHGVTLVDNNLKALNDRITELENKLKQLA